MNTTIQSAYRGVESMNWQTWLENGDQYLKAATPKGQESRFRGDVRYNLLAMAFESYAMAISDHAGTLPYNHTFTDLVDAIDPLVNLPGELKERILAYEDVQSICSIDAYHRGCPDKDGLDDLKGALEKVRRIARDFCTP